MNAVRLGLAVIALALPVDATAQTGTVGARFEVTGAAGLQTGADLGARNGDLRANSTTAQPFTLFTTDSTMSRSWLADVRLGFVMSRRVSMEGRLGYSRPTLETSVGADTEGAASITVVERVDQYVIDAGVVISLDEMRFGRVVPYAAGGVGYLRQLHEGFTAIEQGHMYHLGGGLKRDLFTRDRRVIRAAGLRVDARVNLLSGGISLGDGVVTQGTLAAGLYFRF
jgi:hypothetical protein